MPQVVVKVNYELTEEAKNAIEEGVVDILVNKIGKRDTWLTVLVEDCSRIYLRGEGKTPTACIQLNIYKQMSDCDAEAFITAVTELIMKYTDVEKNRISVIIQPVSQWGLGGKYFS